MKQLRTTLLVSTTIAVGGLAGCANGASHHQLYSELSPNTVETLESAPLSPYCDATAQLEGRGSGGGFGPVHGLTAGGFVYNSMLMGLSPVIALQDREDLEKKVQDVLDQESDGRSLEWVAPSSGQKVIMNPGGTSSSFRLVSVPRAEEVGRTPESFRVERGEYVTTKEAALRPSPTSSGNVRIDTVPAGYKLNVMGRVAGVQSDSWYMVGSDGRAFGYMEPADLQPRSLLLVNPPKYNRITGPTLRDPISATVTCRELSYTTDIGEETLHACRSPEGRWVADPPAGFEGGRTACLPISRSYLLR